MDLSLENESGDELPRDCEEAMRRAASAALEMESPGLQAEASVIITTSEEIKRLNKKHRGIDRETDVLSFPLYKTLPTGQENKNLPELLLGDIVISLEKAKAQAEEYGHSLKRELAFLTVHSCLHLFGYDHCDEESEKAMFAKQDQILERAGIGR
ncbi:MAG: rRNA maturation RNase YbeY [Clostridiales bacterium]|jgi:probable rRNA maturation factor|nr:rRNA maturation RNase YbeY [Clostridiales bacterium]